MKFDILKHTNVPEHEVLSDSEVKKIFKELDFEKEHLPKIKVDDPVSKYIEAKVGDVLKIIRHSQTAGTYVTYRLVEE